MFSSITTFGRRTLACLRLRRNAASLGVLLPSLLCLAPSATAVEPENLVITNFRVTPAVIRVGEAFTVRITVYNRGSERVISQRPRPGTAYRLGESAASQGFPGIDGRVRVGVSVSGPRGRDYPYRWGLGGALPTVRSRTIEGRIVFDRPGVYAFYAAAIVEGAGIHPAAKVVSGLRVLDGRRQRPRNVRPPVPPTRLVVNGDVIDSPQPPLLVGGVVFVPSRFPSEALGADVDWAPAAKRVDIRKDGQEIQLTVGRLTSWVNGRQVTMYQRPFINEDRTYVPLRLVAEALGARVRWDGPTRTVRIDTL